MTYTTHGNTGKRNAAKPEPTKATENVYTRCKKVDKDLWLESANNEKLKLSEWIVKNLNRSCKMTLEKQVIQTIKGTHSTEELKSIVRNFLASIGRKDLIMQSYDEAAYELSPSPESDILLEAVKQWDVLIKDEDA